MFYEYSLTLTSKPLKHIKGKERYRTSLMSVDEKFLNKILTEWIQWYFKRISLYE